MNLRSLVEGGDAASFCDVYDNLGLYAYSTPANWGKPRADEILLGAEDYQVATCILDRSHVGGVQLHLATVGPITYKFAFETLWVPE